MKRFCQGCNLLALILDDQMPSFIKPLTDRLRSFLATQYHGTLEDENESHGQPGWTAERLSDQPWIGFSADEKRRLKDLGAMRPVSVSRLLRDGREVYQSVSTVERNSSIRYYSKYKGRMTAGKIVGIFQDGSNQKGNVGVFVRSFECLNDSDAVKDPYRRYPELVAEIFYAELEAQIEAISLGGYSNRRRRLIFGTNWVWNIDEIEGHVATCPLSSWKSMTLRQECVITVGLDRVSSLPM